MADWRSVDRLEVWRDQTLVGELMRLPKGCMFRPLAPADPPLALHLPPMGSSLIVEGVANLPTYFAGLLPEGVMLEAVRRAKNVAEDDLFALLVLTGYNPIGDLSIQIPGEPQTKESMTLAEARVQIRRLLEKKEGVMRVDLVGVPGVQPKMSIGALVRSGRSPQVIVKFQPPGFPGLLKNELIFMKLARRCGIRTADVRLDEDILVVRRFDRAKGPNGGIARLHIEDMLQASDRYPHSKYSLEFSDIMWRLVDLDTPKSTLLDAVRLYVYSYAIGNGDLHAKNISIQRDPSSGSWSLTPAYDLLSTLPYRAALSDAERMALALHDEAFGRFTREEFVCFGAEFGLSRPAVEKMVLGTAGRVLKAVDDLDVDLLGEWTLGEIRSRAISLIA